MRTLWLLLVLGAAPVLAQANLCSAGKNCSVKTIKTADGTAALPSYSWISDTNTGLYRPSADAIGLSCNGAAVCTVRTTGLQCQNGSAANPSYNFTANSTTGFFHDGTGIGAAQAGVLIANLTDNGLDLAGKAFASFPAAAAGNNGTQQYDTTNTAYRYSDGSSWKPIGPSLLVDEVTTYIPSAVALLNVASAQLTAPRQLFGAGGSTSNWGVVSIRLASATTITAGVGAGNAVYTVYNFTDTAATTATVTVPCASAAGTVTAGSVDSTVSFTTTTKALQIRLTTNGCGTLPAVNITWGYAVTPAGT